MVAPPISWLLEGDPYIQYRTRLDLLGQNESDERVIAAHDQMRAEPKIKALLAKLASSPGTVISGYMSAGQPFHKLTFLIDLGLKSRDLITEYIISHILDHQSDEAPHQLPASITSQYDDTAMGTWAWALCDVPLVVDALANFGFQDHPAVRAAQGYLVGLVRKNGWPCVVSKELGRFRGPGRKGDPCPFATLAMLKLLSSIEEWRNSLSSQIGAETLPALWQQSDILHPYMFFMGTHFSKLKIPFIWYDLVHVLDELSRFPWLRRDGRLLGMMEVLRSKVDDMGCFTNDCVWTA